MARKPRRDAWKIVEGKWTRSFGSRGTRVRLFERTKGGAYYRDVHVAGRGKNRRSLGTKDRAEAERLARELVSALLREEEIIADGVVTLAHLWERYRTEASAFLDNDPRTRHEDAVHVSVLLGFFGDACDVRDLTEADAQAFTTARLAGGIIYNVEHRRNRTGSGTAVTGPVRARSAEVELRILRTMLRWATTVRGPNGQRLLASNPLAGIRTVREKNPKRPVATWERFQATRDAMRELATQNAGDPETHRHWLRMELALTLAEATGRRIGAIRQLRWEDFDFANSKVTWRADADKTRRDWVVPLPATLVKAIRRFRIKLGGAFSGLIFPSRAHPEKALDRHAFQKALVTAERAAGLTKLDGSAWHAYRRAWASSRKHLPLTDVAAAGGWKGARTLLGVYQQPDMDTMLAVMSETKKYSDRATGT